MSPGACPRATWWRWCLAGWGGSSSARPADPQSPDWTRSDTRQRPSSGMSSTAWLWGRGWPRLVWDPPGGTWSLDCTETQTPSHVTGTCWRSRASCDPDRDWLWSSRGESYGKTWFCGICWPRHWCCCLDWSGAAWSREWIAHCYWRPCGAC